MNSLRDLEVFIAIGDAGSLTAAAEKLGRSLQAVSRSLQSLETQMGTTLIARTTRTMRLTTAGERFRDRIKNILADLDAAATEASDEILQLQGRLHINASSQFGPAYVVPLISEFLSMHSSLTAKLDLDDDFNDPVTSSADVTIRIGELADSQLIARRLASVRRVLFASPRYLAKRGYPSVPQDLTQHDCVIRTDIDHPRIWRFIAQDRREILVNVNGRIEANHANAVNQSVVCAMGIGIASFWQVRPLLEAGQVELLLPDFQPPPMPLNAIWVRKKRLPARVRLFVDFLAERLDGALL
ncbi:MAG TPA: LysR family transcriptional regulator [Burkholderiaceae bacterium]|nr:LysR family transcriptional regulator [Burkholderiaceae bacterium]